MLNTMRVLLGFVLMYSVSGFLFEDITKTVSTPIGDIVGLISDVPMSSSVSHKVQTYKGIPYAESPTGMLRFQKPVPKGSFQTPYDARKQNYSCVQYTQTPYPVSEDCLRLNIYVPGDGSALHVVQDTAKPVMIWIHGGGFTGGSSYDNDASVLSTFGDVIVVTINYRLAHYGFLTTADSYAPGNMGLWDQHLAIQWVHDNIKAFGGDTSRVTLFGQSAGSTSVIYQTFYPGNKGLFQHAIAESGTSISSWAYISQENQKKIARKFSMEAGCNETTPAEYIRCLSAKPLDILSQTVMGSPRNALPVPVLDHAFILDEPANIISGQTNALAALDMYLSVDLIIGFDSGDSLIGVGVWLQWANSTDIDNFTLPKHVYENTAIPLYTKYFFSTENITEAVINEVVHVYTDWSDPEDNVKRLRKIIDLGNDITFVIPTVDTAKLHTNSTKNTFIYEFSARPLRHGFRVPSFLDGPTVVNHGDELSYVFGNLLKNESERADLRNQYRTTLLTMTLWTNFAKSGNPNTPEDVTHLMNTTWPTYTDQEKYLDITFDMSPESVKSRVRPEAVNLWEVLIPKLLGTNKKCN